MARSGGSRVAVRLLCGVLPHGQADDATVDARGGGGGREEEESLRVDGDSLGRDQGKNFIKPSFVHDKKN